MCDYPKPLTEDDVRRIASELLADALIRTIERGRYNDGLPQGHSGLRVNGVPVLET